MPTIFTHCKAFDGHVGVIQSNAIQSWLKLSPPCEIFLCGDRPGTAEAAREYGVGHIPVIRRNEYGTPFVSDLFEVAQRAATHRILCYLNCDLILTSSFVEAVARVSRIKDRFLIVGECSNLDLTHRLDFTNPAWERDLHELVQRSGTRRGARSVDYFVFTRHLYDTLPPFVLGTAYYDNWLIWKAYSTGAASVDATPSTMPVHQNHDYTHIAGGYLFTRRGENAQRNLALAGGRRHIFLIHDTKYRLEPSGLRRNVGLLLRLGFPREMQDEYWWRFVEQTRPLRHSLGLNMRNIQRARSLLRRIWFPSHARS